MGQFSLLKKDRNNSTGSSIKRNPYKHLMAHMAECTAQLKTKKARMNRIVKELKLLEEAMEIWPDSIQNSANKIYDILFPSS